MLFTLYDGYYIYSRRQNTESGQYEYGLKPYVYYAARYKKGNTIDTVFDGASGYSARLREMLQLIYPNVQLNVINAGISGDTAEGGAALFILL